MIRGINPIITGEAKYAFYDHVTEAFEVKLCELTQLNLARLWCGRFIGRRGYEWIYIGVGKFAFKKKVHAMLFKLVWG